MNVFPVSIQLSWTKQVLLLFARTLQEYYCINGFPFSFLATNFSNNFLGKRGPVDRRQGNQVDAGLWNMCSNYDPVIIINRNRINFALLLILCITLNPILVDLGLVISLLCFLSLFQDTWLNESGHCIIGWRLDQVMWSQIKLEQN